jgi:hypothetical protein
VDSTWPPGTQEEEVNFTLYKVCRVKWRDIIASNEWEKHPEIKCPVLESIGWHVYEDDETVKIANTLDFDDWEDKGADKPVPYGITAFPKGCIVKIIYL